MTHVQLVAVLPAYIFKMTKSNDGDRKYPEKNTVVPNLIKNKCKLFVLIKQNPVAVIRFVKDYQ